MALQPQNHKKKNLKSSLIIEKRDELYVLTFATRKYNIMYISNMSHFLDEQGNIAKEMNKTGRERASFLALLVDTATNDYAPSKKTTEIRCLTKKCSGTIDIEVDTKIEFIHWSCNNCSEEGRISDWQKTKWDNRK